MLAGCTLWAMPGAARAQESAGAAQASPPSPAAAIIASSTGAVTALGVSIAAILSAPAVAGAHWGIAVTSMDGTPIYGLDEAKLFRPASSAKLFTTAAALAILGPEYKETTEVRGDLDAAQGTVTGDLILVGAGDASFGTHDLPYIHALAVQSPSGDLASLADQLVAKGVRHVTGEVVGDDALFAHEPPPEGWAAEDLQWGYGALPSALSIGDNELRVTVSSYQNASTLLPGNNLGATVTVEQIAPYMTLASSVRTVPNGAASRNAISITPGAAQPNTFMVSGTVSAGAPPVVEHLSISDSALYAAEALRQLLMVRGVIVDGVAGVHHALTDTSEPTLKVLRTLVGCGWAYPGEQQSCLFDCLSPPLPKQSLATQTSHPLIADVTFTLKTSANLHAELMLRQLGLKNACPGATSVHGAALVRTWAVHAGVPPEDILLYDGSGLSTKDLVTPRSEAQLLAYAGKQPWFAAWKAALPVGGVDGTLTSRFTEAPLKGHVFAKTGTLGESRALAGYVQCASGREVIFSILDDDHEPGSSADRVAMDAIVAAIAANE